MEDNIIYFIYCQEGNQNNIETIEKNKIVLNFEKKEENHKNGRIYIIYSLEVSNEYYKTKPFTLIIMDKALNIYYKEIYPGQYKYDIFFNPLEKTEEANINQIHLSIKEQFNIFKNYINDNDDLNKLYLDTIDHLSKIEQDSYFNYILFFFTEIYEQYKSKPYSFKDTIKKFFESLNVQLFENKKQFSKPTIDDNLKNTEIFSNVHEIRNELISITENKKEINIKIDVFLGFYYIHFKQKLFIQFLNINNTNFNEIKSHLLFHKKIFNGFNSAIINLELMNETENLEQIQTLVSHFIPNRLEFFKILADENFYIKLSFLSQIDGKKLLLCKQQNDDDIKKISEYFCKIMNLRKIGQDYYPLPITINEAFFIDYCKMYLNKNLNNFILIQNMLYKFNEIYKTKIIIDIDKYYHDTGKSLIKEGKLVNYDLLKFLHKDTVFEEDKSSIPFDDICKGIIFDKDDKKFVNDFFNNQIDEVDLKKIFGYSYEKFMKSILNTFKKPSDLLLIKNLEFEDPVHEDLVRLFLNAIKKIWLDNPQADMFITKKLIGDVFRLASKKFSFFEEVINEIEKKFPILHYYPFILTYYQESMIFHLILENILLNIL